jgi:hypothetical protein
VVEVQSRSCDATSLLFFAKNLSISVFKNHGKSRNSINSIEKWVFKKYLLKKWNIETFFTKDAKNILFYLNMNKKKIIINFWKKCAASNPSADKQTNRIIQGSAKLLQHAAETWDLFHKDPRKRNDLWELFSDLIKMRFTKKYVVWENSENMRK